MITALFTGLLFNGGIQQASQHVAMVLSEIARQNKEPCHLLSLNDPNGLHGITVGGQPISIRGFDYRKAAFARVAIALGIRSRFVYMSHVNLSPIGLVCNFLHRSSRYVVAAHGVEVWERLPLLRRAGLRRSSLVTAPSVFTANQMIRANDLDTRRVRVLPWALEPSRIRDGAAMGTTNRPPRKILLSVARMDKADRQKGLDTVIRSLPGIAASFPSVEYVIAGEGDDRARLERLAKELGVDSAVRFPGSVSDADLINLYRACDVFVMPSQQEGFGLVFIEAMAFGKPVVAANYGGSPEVVLDGTTGFLVEYDDVNALTERLLQLLGDEGLRRSMGDAGRMRILLDYQFDTFKQRLSSLVDEVSRGEAIH